MRRCLFVAGVLACLFASTELAHGLGGNLDRPGIAVPTVGQGDDKKPDATVKAMHEALSDQKDLFVGGWFINSHTKLYFRGDAKQISAALERLAKIDGAEITVRLSKQAGVAQQPFPVEESAPPEKPADRSCQWMVEHNAWTTATALQVVIYLGDPAVEIEELSLPTVYGRKPAASQPVELSAPAEPKP
jgi:hypothetical protein